MAGHFIYQFTLSIALFIIGNIAIAETKATETIFYNQGDEFALKAYEDHPSVYVRIDDVVDHPFLGKYYLLSFHGICLSTHAMSKIISTSQKLDQVTISHEALNNSVVEINIDKKNSMLCEGGNVFDLVWYKDFILIGGMGVLISPLSSSLTESDSPKITTFIHN